MIQLPLLFTGITICWVSKLSFFITLLRLVRNKTQKTVLWIAMTTSSVFLFSLSIVQPFAQCGSVLVALLNENDSKHCVPHNITVPMTLAAYAFAALTVSISLCLFLDMVPRHGDVRSTFIADCLVILPVGFPLIHGPNTRRMEASNAAPAKDCHHLCYEHRMSVSFLFLQRVHQRTYLAWRSSYRQSLTQRPPLLSRAGIVAILKVIKTYETFFLGQQELYAAGLGIALNSVEVSCTIIGASIPFIRLLVPKLTQNKKKGRSWPWVFCRMTIISKEERRYL